MVSNKYPNTKNAPHQDILKQWGISETALGGFQPDFSTYQKRPALLLATGQKTRRRVIFLDDQQPKIKWYYEDQEKPQPVIFNPEALETPGDTLIKLNGEKSVLAALSAGIANVFTTPNGENKRGDIQTAIEHIMLHSDKRRILVYPDCDPTGTKDAKHWLDLGTAAGLTVEIYDLRQHPGAQPKWDTRDLWLLDQDPARFQARLDCLPLFDFDRYADELPASSPPPRPATSQRDSTGKFNPLVIAALENALLAAGGKRKGNGTIAMPSWSNHNRDKPGLHATYYPNQYENPLAKEFSTGETLGVKELCERYPVDYHALGGLYETGSQNSLYLAPNIDLTRRPDENPVIFTPDSVYFPGGIPRLFTRSLLQCKQDNAALVYYILHDAIEQDLFDPDQAFTTTDVVNLSEQVKQGRNTTKKTAAKGIKQLQAAGFINSAEQIIQGKGKPAESYRLVPIEQALLTYRQRRAIYHREKAFTEPVITPDTVKVGWFSDLLPEEAQQQANLENVLRATLYEEYQIERQQAETRYKRGTNNDTLLTSEYLIIQNVLKLPSGEWRNTKQFKDGYYLAAATVRANNEFTISVKAAARQIGTSETTLRAIRRRVGIVADERFQEYPLEPSSSYLQQVDELAPWAAGRAYGRYVKSSGGMKVAISPSTENNRVERWAANQISQGHTLTFKVQTASQERLATVEEKQALLEKDEAKRAVKKVRNERYRKERNVEPIKVLLPKYDTLPEKHTAEYLALQRKLLPKEVTDLGKEVTPPNYYLPDLLEGGTFGANSDKDVQSPKTRRDPDNHSPPDS